MPISTSVVLMNFLFLMMSINNQNEETLTLEEKVAILEEHLGFYYSVKRVLIEENHIE